MIQQLIACDGKINTSGFCDKCYQVAQTSSNVCGRLMHGKQLQQGGVSGKQLPLEFVKWYSGMEEEKILKAFDKWSKEVVCASGAVDKTVSDGFWCVEHDRFGNNKCKRQCELCETERA